MIIACVHKLGFHCSFVREEQAELTNQIQTLGGTVVSSVSKKTTLCISNLAEVTSGSKKMLDAENKNVPIVDEGFLIDASKGEALSKIPLHTISSWGAPRHTLAVQEQSGVSKAFKKGWFKELCLQMVQSAVILSPSRLLAEGMKVKMQLKQGSVVDPDSGEISPCSFASLSASQSSCRIG